MADGYEEIAVRNALPAMERAPPTRLEHEGACRSLIRFRKVGGRSSGSAEEPAIANTDEWVRLYVALRCARGSACRLNESDLRPRKARVSCATTIKRKCYLVEKSRLDALPEYPPRLEDWIIPHGELDLPADPLVADDRFDRIKLRVPLLHVELAVKWTRQHSSNTSHPPAAAAWTAAPSAPAGATIAPMKSSAATAAPAVAPPAAPAAVAAAPAVREETAAASSLWEASDSMYHIAR